MHAYFRLHRAICQTVHQIIVAAAYKFSVGKRAAGVIHTAHLLD